MRLQLRLSPNDDAVPFNHLHQLTGTLHKWLGQNEFHDRQSLYSFGWLRGGTARRGQLHFPAGASWNISFYDENMARRLLKGLLNDPTTAYGMTVEEVQELEYPGFSGQRTFYTDGSAIVLRRKREDASREYLLWDHPEADQALTHSLRHKMQQAGLGQQAMEIRAAFDRQFQRARSRKITIKGIDHKGSECPVVLQGNEEALHFAWLVGLGELTGSGFGALR